MIMSCGCNNINCQANKNTCSPCSTNHHPYQAPSGLHGRHNRQAPSGLKGAFCEDCPDMSIGMPKIISSHEVDNNKRTAVFFKHGGCEVIDKGYIPSTQNLTSNGPKYQRTGCNENGEHLESEGMDCPNYIFNRSQAGNP